MNLVTPTAAAKPEIVQHAGETSLLNIKEAPESVTKFILMIIMHLVIPEAAAKHELLFNKPVSAFYGFSKVLVEQ